MIKIVMYLLESSAILAFFYLFYILVLRRETFFNLNRFFLLGILVFSVLLPLVSFDFNPPSIVSIGQPIEEITKFRTSYYEALDTWDFEGQQALVAVDTSAKPHPFIGSVDWNYIMLTALIAIYLLGVIIHLIKTAITLLLIRNIIKSNPNEIMDGVIVVKTSNNTAPFSFLKYVFIQNSMVKTVAFDQILAHEKTHIQQKHSIDLIFVQPLAAFFWFNPLIWQLIKSLKTNHEYIVDKKIISAGYSLVEYQTLLLRQLISNNSYGLVHNFNLSFIKKRITMMKNNNSGWAGKVKVAMTITSALILGAVIVQCNSALDEQVSLEMEKVNEGLIETRYILSEEVSLPVLPDLNRSGPRVIIGMPETETRGLEISLANNQLEINMRPHTVDEIVSVIENKNLGNDAIIVMSIDANQTMEMVFEVQQELRKANMRKIVYKGKSETGKSRSSRVLLPPLPNDPKFNVPELDEAYIAKTGIDVLYRDLGKNEGVINQQKVDELVRKHMEKQSSNYAVSLTYDANDTYSVFLSNLIFVQEAFYQIYQERAQKMFGKNYLALDRNNEEEKAQHNAVRKGIPQAITIAELK